MNYEKLPLKGTLENLTPEWPADLMGSIQRCISSQNRKIVILDDDPTGTQTVHDIPVLTDWSVKSLMLEMLNRHPAFFILTNTRSMPARKACRLNREIGGNLKIAANKTSTLLEVISRSDSTLRGHYPAEVDALAEAMGDEMLPRLIVPCFFEGGRYTIADVHYVAENGFLVPAAHTTYATDDVFGYNCDNLKQWVEEKTKGRIQSCNVVSISLKDIREGGPGRVAGILEQLSHGSVCIVNAAAYRDLEVLVHGLLSLGDKGRRFVCRTAASFVRVRCGIQPQGLLSGEGLTTGNRNGGLFVAGSHVPKTTQQIDALLKQNDISAIQVDIGKLLDDTQQSLEIERVQCDMNQSVGAGKDTLIFTSRQLVKGTDDAESLVIGQKISDGLIEIINGLAHRPGYLVAKGGITASDVAAKGLGVRRALVMGQVLPGVPVWKLGSETRYPGLAYIVFPGNVGAADALCDIRNRLRSL